MRAQSGRVRTGETKMTVATMSGLFRVFAAPLLACIGMAGLPAVAAAKTQEIKVAQGKDWKHKWTGAILPAERDGFKRTEVGDYSSNQTDVIVTYQDEKARITATVYVFRAGIADGPIWNDRILSTMRGMQFFPGLAFDKSLAHGFVPPGGTIASGWRTTVPFDGGASGVSVFRHDDWLIVVRMSSHSLGSSELDGRLDGFVSALSVPSEEAAPIPAYAVADCADRLPTAPAKATAPGAAEGMGLAIAETMRNTSPAKLAKDDLSPLAPAEPYCREAPSTSDWTLYRPGGSRGHYAIAIGDAGAGLYVDRSDILSELGMGANFGAVLVTGQASVVLGTFETLPPPDQVLALAERGHALATVVKPAKPGDGPTIQIDPTSLK